MRRLALFLFLLPSCLLGQFNTEQIASPFSNTENGSKYLAPLNEVYSSFMNAGVFPRLSEEGFHIKLGLHVSRISYNSNLTSYSGNTEGLPANTTTEAPTILGANIPLTIESSGDSYTFPAGAGVENITLAIPELYIGTLVGTDIYGRYITFPTEGDLGSIELYGGGIRHDFGRYFLPEYMKWHLAYNYHMFSLGDNIKSTNQYALTQLGFQLNRIGFYGLFGYELSEMSIQYDLAEPEQDVNLVLSDTMPFRYGGGINLSFKFFEIYSEYNMNDPVNLVFGVSLGI